MSTITKGTVASNTQNTRYGFMFDSIYNTMLKPQIWGEYIKRYSAGVGLLEFIHFMGAIVSIAGPSKTVWEEGSLVKLVKLNGPIATALVGADITFSIDAAEYTGNACYLNTNDQIIIPAYYMRDTATQSIMPHRYQITGNDGGAAAARVYTAKPLLSTSTLAIAVPDNTELMVTGGNYALESQSGSGKASGWYSRTFKTSIKKHDWQIGGGTQSNQRYYEELRGGGTGILTKNTLEADYWLSKYINDEIMLSQGLTNTFTMTNRAGVAIQATATVGILKHMVNLAMKQYYTTAYQSTDFDDLKDLLNSQGITSRNVTFLMGSNLYKQVENSGLEFIKEYSGGTDFTRMMNEINVAFKFINKNGVYVTLKEIPSFSDPVAYGADAFDDYFKDLGMILPDADVTVKTGNIEEASAVKLKNLTLGYKNYNGENRTRIIKDIPSVASAGNIAVDTYDDSRGTMLSEFMLIFTNVNQSILVLNDNIL